jgi:hypothetical protein
MGRSLCQKKRYERFRRWQENNPKVTFVHLWHLAPAFNAPICLNYLPNWCVNGALNPRVLDQRPIRTLPYRLEVTGEFHFTKVTERGGGTGAA